LPNFKLPAINNVSKKQAMFALQPIPDDFGNIEGPNA